MKLWRCPACNSRTTSSPSVRARYCGRCLAWCELAAEEREPEPRIASTTRLGRRPTLREAMRSERAGIAGEPAGEILFDAGAPIPPMAPGRWGRA